MLDVLGAVDTEVYSRLLRLTLARDLPGVMGQIEELVVQGRELSQFVTDFTWYLRNLLLLKTTDRPEEAEEVLDVSTENLRRLQEEAHMLETDTLMRYIPHFLGAGRTDPLRFPEAGAGGGGLHQALPAGHGDEHRCDPGSAPDPGAAV